jgi:two-component system, sensor histidine kinase and response regulator
MDTLRVLVADDEAGMRHSIARALQSFKIALPGLNGDFHFNVEGVPSGEEALEKIDAAAPDILLLDHKMGGMSGIGVLERLAGRDLDMLTIMVTAFATIETAVRATKTGAFDFIAKPFTPDELKETIRKAASHLIVQRQARKLAAEKHRVRFEFISVLGHELKSPLGAIENYLNILKDRTLGSDLPAYDEVIGRCKARAEGMQKLIIDLLDLTRIESGLKKREVTEVDVAAAAAAVIDGNKLAAEKRGISIALTGPSPLMMTADRGEIEIVLNNLVTNAVKYNRDKGRVDVRLTTDDETVKIVVADTGIGLSPEEAQRLFSDFVRIKNEKTRNISGSGLGLSIVRKIAQLYGGTAAVESTPGVGSTFTVELKRRSPAKP